MIQVVVVAFMALCLAFTVGQYLAFLLWAVLGSRHFDQRRAGNRDILLAKVAAGRALPGVSIILPAYNEEAIIVQSVKSALEQDYPNLEVIVVNDGSTDRTVDALAEAYGMRIDSRRPPTGEIPTERVVASWASASEARLRLLDKEPSGAKADGSNAGINVARFPYVVVMDADEFMEKDVITRCMAEVLSDPEEVVGVGTTLLPANHIAVDGSDIVERKVPTNYWVGCQLVEYFTAFMVARPGLTRLRAMPIISGGFGLFRRDLIVDVGGYVKGHLGEDMEMCMRLHRHLLDEGRRYRIAQVPEAIVWTEFPYRKDVLRAQRIRWHRGLRMILREYGDMFGRRRYRSVGTVGVGYLRVFEWWGPFLEAIGWTLLVLLLALGWINPFSALAVFLIAQFLGMALSMIGVTMGVTRLSSFQESGSLRRMIIWVVAFSWGYRQITLLWRIRSLFPGATGWGEMTRLGIATATEPVKTTDPVKA